MLVDVGMALSAAAVIRPNGSLDDASLAELDRVTTQWRPSPVYVTFLGWGSSRALAIQAASTSRHDAESCSSIPAQLDVGGAIAVFDGSTAAQDGSAGRSVGVFMGTETQPVHAVRLGALAMQLSGAIVMLVSNGRRVEALRELAAAAALAVSVRPKSADGSESKLPCHLFWIETTPPTESSNSSSSMPDGEAPGASSSSSLGSPIGVSSRNPASTFLTSMESTQGVTGTGESNKHRAVLMSAFLSIHEETLSAFDASRATDRSRRFVSRIVAKARLAPVQAKPASAVLQATASRLDEVLAAAPIAVARSIPSKENVAQWAATVAQSVLDQDLARWYAGKSANCPSTQEIKAQKEICLAVAGKVAETFAVPVEEARAILSSADLVVDALVRDGERRSLARAVVIEREQAARATARFRGPGRNAVTIPITGWELVLPPANDVPESLRWLEIRIPSTHRFWITWTGIATIGILGTFVIVTMYLMLRTS
jgi:hypothetical protein